MRPTLIVLLCLVLVLPLPPSASALARDTSPELDAVVGTAPLAEPEVQASAPRFGPPRQQQAPGIGVSSGPIPEPPAVSVVVAEHDLLAPGLVMPRRCTSGRNDGRFDGAGLLLRVTGRCLAASTTAAIEAIQPDVKLGDGEVRVQFKVERGHGRARVGIDLGDADTGRILAIVDPGDDSAAILRPAPDGNVEGVRGSGTRSVAGADGWTTIALRQRGTEAWLMVGDQPVLHSTGSTPAAGLPSILVSRAGSIDDADDVAVALRGFAVSSVDGADPARPVERAARPVVDPRYERIMAFIETDLAEAAGDDPSTVERREIGRAMQAMLAESSLNLLVEPLPDKTAARFDSRRRAILVDEELLSFTPHVATMLLLHEVTHAHQEYVGEPVGCGERELDAHRWNARLWRAWFGRDGKQPPGDSIEADFSATVRLDNAGRLQEAIERLYAQQCEGR